jgi:hypothetical protein
MLLLPNEKYFRNIKTKQNLFVPRWRRPRQANIRMGKNQVLRGGASSERDVLLPRTRDAPVGLPLIF